MLKFAARMLALGWLAGFLFASAAVAQAMRVHLIDVGQGAATLFEFPCAAVLVDTGGEASKDFKSTEALVTYLDEFFERRSDLRGTLSLLVLTHPHIDHTRGVREVLSRYRVLNAVTNGQETGSGRSGQKLLHDRVAASEESADPQDHIGYAAAWSEDITAVGVTSTVIDPVRCPTVDPQIRILWGSSRQQPGWTAKDMNNQNNHSVVLRVDHGRASMVITGDLETSAVGSLIARHASLRALAADVYQVGHHGSHNATTDALLRAISPRYAVIGSGVVERQQPWTAWAYGHPRKAVIDLLERHVRERREPVVVPIGLGAKRFADVQVSKAIYATGWDSHVILEAQPDGRWRILSADDSLADAAQPLVNLNTASRDELVALPMIGPARADAIVRSRETEGPFSSLEDLLRVRGIGRGTLNVLRHLTTTQ